MVSGFSEQRFGSLRSQKDLVEQWHFSVPVKQLFDNAPSSSHDQLHLSRGASYLVMQSLGTVLIYVLAFVVLARIVSTKEMGIWAILQLISATCFTFGTLCLPQAVTKFVAENSAAKERTVAAAAYYQALRFTLVLSVLIGSAIFVAAPYLAIHLLGSLSYVTLFQVLAFDVLFDAGAIPVVSSALLGVQMFKETAIVGLIAGGLMRQLLIIGLILMLRNFVGLVYGWLLSDAVTFMAYFILLLRALGAPRFDFPLKGLLSFSIPLTFGSLAGYAQTWFDRALLVVFVPLTALGVYNAALTAFSALLGISAAMGNMLFPAYSSLQKLDRRRMGEAIRLAIRYANFTLVPLTLGLFALARPALALFVGESYASGTVPLMIFSGVFAFSIVGFTALAPILLALEKTRLAGIIASISVIIGLVVAYLLLPTWGIVGASAARGLAMAILGVLIIIVVAREVPVYFEFKTILKTLFAGMMMVAVIFGVELFRYGKLLLPVYVTIGVLVYLVMLRILKTVNRNDTALIRSLLGRRLAFVSGFLSWILIPDEN